MKPTILILFLITPIFLLAQYSKPTRIYEKGQVDLQASVGLFQTYVADKPESILPPVNLAVRWLITDQVSLGLFAAHSASRIKADPTFDSSDGSWHNKTYFVGIENGFHYTKMDNWDIYGGLSLFYQYVKIEASEPGMEKIKMHSGIKSQSGKLRHDRFCWCPQSAVPSLLPFCRAGVWHFSFQGRSWLQAIREPQNDLLNH